MTASERVGMSGNDTHEPTPTHTVYSCTMIRGYTVLVPPSSSARAGQTGRIRDRSKKSPTTHTHRTGPRTRPLLTIITYSIVISNKHQPPPTLPIPSFVRRRSSYRTSPPLQPHSNHPGTMSLSLTRINLAPTSRALSTGLPISTVNHALKGIQAGGHGSGHSADEHGHAGPRRDKIPTWVGSQAGGLMQTSRSNRECPNDGFS